MNLVYVIAWKFEQICECLELWYSQHLCLPHCCILSSSLCSCTWSTGPGLMGTRELENISCSEQAINAVAVLWFHYILKLTMPKQKRHDKPGMWYIWRLMVKNECCVLLVYWNPLVIGLYWAKAIFFKLMVAHLV